MSPKKNKRRQEEDQFCDGTRPVAKVARMAKAEEETSMSTQKNKRRQKEVRFCDGTRPVAKVARLANAKEETWATETIMNLVKDLWSDDNCVIKIALTKIRLPWSEEKEQKMRVLGVHTAVFQVLQKHVGCLEIQEKGMRVLGFFCHLKPTKTLLGDIGCVEVVLARMEEYPDSERIQWYGCLGITNLVRARSMMKDNAERVEKSGGIAVVIAAMKAHSNCERVQSMGCCALSSMSEREEYRSLIVEAGGASAIAFVMEKGWDNPRSTQIVNNAMEKLIKKPR